MTNGDWTGKLIDRGSDWTGLVRRSYITIKGKNGNYLTIITGYRCSKLAIKNAGPKTALFQQYSIMREKGEKNPSPATAFFRDLSKWMQPKIENGDEILLTIDAKEECTEDSDVKKITQANGLYNLATEMYEDLPPTKPQSGNKIDFLFGT